MKSNKINMCDTCINEFATCNPEFIEFGDGKGMDNVIVCNSFITKNIGGTVHTNDELDRVRKMLDEVE